ncbi:MAG: Carbonic anhydrase precursor [Methanomethylovorans sp. PtaU1.Bin093]|jgi:carbonic anhydrase/acetyltransferase-like protein (isoleucine patch superfamily)|uniref:carbonate dehydratase n=1 Tax=Methanomethylovorans sp. PtaU1.Bin093 TaxID=1811679 RepID=UPI0009CA0B79|nr:carbonate dehydratase [Methanomethylovorans sp. PtaU1.Bin093]OPY22291.1 MAG: Carbonic anhydrase precursor [Methanomethylovorans sp. PtaU1.Bin093]
MQLENPQKQRPKISKKAWISETAIIIGNVHIGDNVFVAHNAIIRADEPCSSIVISDGCNVQDNVIIHALSHSQVLIGPETSLAHGCIVHGPCKIGTRCFVGFGSVVFDCIIGDDTLVMHNATVRKIIVPDGKVIPDGMAINRQAAVEDLGDVTPDLTEFKGSVVRANIDLVQGYQALEMEV